MRQLGIAAVAVTRNTQRDNVRIWQEIERADYRIVYVSPEVILNKRGAFLGRIARQANAFMDKLVAVAVDEAHLIWDWIGFRDKFQMLGNLHLVLTRVGWVLLSATLSPMVAAYAHEICNLQRPSMRFIRSMSRDNVNMMVCPVSNMRDFTPLLTIIPLDRARDLLAIPKTIIFYDGIEGGQRIAAALRTNITPELAATHGRNVLVQMFYGSIDEPKKRQILSDLRSGRCRVVICTDAFGLGVDIGDIKWVIQWGIDGKVTSLMLIHLTASNQVSISSLTQRAGRAARRLGLIGIFFVFVTKAIVEAVPNDWESGWNAPEAAETDEWVDVDDDDEDDGPRVVPVSKMRQVERFGLPVTAETRIRVSAFIRNIYTEAKTIKEAYRIAKNEVKGTRTAKLSAAQKLDPAVLWVICTMGCRRKAMLSIYKDENTYTDNHRSWCCDRCAKRLLGEPGTLFDRVQQDIETDKTLLARSISFLKSDPKSQKVILLDEKTLLGPQSAVFELPSLPITKHRRNQLKKRLCAARASIIARAGLPSLLTPEMVLPDAVIDHILQGIRKVRSADSLEQLFREVNFDIGSGLIPEGKASLPALYRFIQETLIRSAHLEESNDKPPAVNH
jgi:superfamily II DNA/RNA helicase